MLLAPTLLCFTQAPDIKTLDSLAANRDVAALTKFLTPDSLKPINPLQVLKTNGAYDTGRFGWHAYDLRPPGSDDSYVVLGTPLTSEDIGEEVFERQGALLRYIAEDNPLGVRIVRHNFDVSFDIPTKTVTISDDLRLKKLPTAGPFFLLRMSPYLHVDSVTGDGKAIPFAQASGVTAMKTFPGRETTLTIKYHGVDNLPQYAGSITDNEATVTNDYWYPMIARWPAPYDLTVHAPKGWMAIGQGEQTSMSEDASGRTTKFRMDLPVTYYSLSTASYKSFSQIDGQRKISAWALDRTPEQLREQTDLFKPILTFYDQNFAPFPFSGYGALHSALYGGGALEAYSFATYGFGVPSEDPHEPSHTWWGGMIDNTYMHSLWNESFAVFCEGLYRRNVPIGNHGERAVAFISDAEPQQDYLAGPCDGGNPWYGSAASSLGYGKGAAVLQMLETEIGTPAMIKTMQEWQKENPKGEPGEWSGYEKAVANVTHKDYSWFFDEWLRRTGWAEFEVKNVAWKKGVLTGDVYFTGQPYRIDCEATLLFADRKPAFLKFNTMQKKVGDHYSFSLPVPISPSLVSIDPWRRVLRTAHPDEEPTQLFSLIQDMKRYSDPAHKDWLPHMGGTSLDALPKDLSDVLIVGTPQTIPQMALLCGKAGFIVQGNKLTYDGTTIDLDEGGALAVVDLPAGKKCIVGLGTFKVRPEFGRARTVVFDRYGRFLRGWTQPKTSGWMTFRLSPSGDKKPAQGHVIR